MGDFILQEIANVLRENIRETDMSFRYGGEEFTVLLPNTSIKGAEHVAEKIRNSVEENVFPVQEFMPSKNLTISVGVSEFPLFARTAFDLIKSADKALYSAKSQGRNQVCLFKEAGAGTDKNMEHCF